MEFRPCIDIHNGKVKQIVGASLRDGDDSPTENFTTEQSAASFAVRYKQDALSGGHIILLNRTDSPHYQATKEQALSALYAYPEGLQVGGGITSENAGEFIEAGASHVIVTSFVFQNGSIHYDNLKSLVRAVGKERIVLDLSCRKREGAYYVVTDRWQNFTKEVIGETLLSDLSEYADEFLIHAADVEGKMSGIEEELVALLGAWGKIPVTYAGGVRDFSDLERMKVLGNNKVHVTIGSALDLFGGSLSYEDVVGYFKKK
ncbi:hypothetical protein FACS1894111_07660 [Clostridia bacterium]|nr:hypothetical protein FACS1894111_07660 [Clostridia bacterium]